MPQPPNHNTPESKKKKANQVLRYSGMGIQLAASIFIGALIGRKLDAYFQTDKDYFTAFLALLFLGVSMYVIMKDLSKNN